MLDVNYAHEHHFMNIISLILMYCMKTDFTTCAVLRDNTLTHMSNTHIDVINAHDRHMHHAININGLFLMYFPDMFRFDFIRPVSHLVVLLAPCAMMLFDMMPSRWHVELGDVWQLSCALNVLRSPVVWKGTWFQDSSQHGAFMDVLDVSERANIMNCRLIQHTNVLQLTFTASGS